MEIILNMKDFLFVDAPGKYMNPIILQKLKGFGIYGNPEHNVNNDMSEMSNHFSGYLRKQHLLFLLLFFLPEYVNTFNAQ